jgi:thioredoxin-related protein
MKKIIPFGLSIFFAITVAASANAQQQTTKPATGTQTPAASTAKIKWMDFEEASALNAKKPKKIFLDMYTDWCGWCKKMDQSTFINPVIVSYMNQHFYAVKFNAERKDTIAYKGKDYYNPNPTGQRTAHQLAQVVLNGRMSYPSFAFMDEEMNMITVVPGYRKAPEFEAILNFIGSDAYKTKKWEEFNVSFERTAVE